MYQEISIIDDDIELTEKLKRIFETEKDYIFKNINSSSIEQTTKDIPDLIIINEDRLARDIVEVCQYIRIYTDNSITPIMVISSNIDKNHRLDILKNNVEYFIKSPMDDEYVYYTIKNIVRLMSSNRKVSPLTGLPGNLQIQVEEFEVTIKKCFKELKNVEYKKKNKNA